MVAVVVDERNGGIAEVEAVQGNVESVGSGRTTPAQAIDVSVRLAKALAQGQTFPIVPHARRDA